MVSWLRLGGIVILLLLSLWNVGVIKMCLSLLILVVLARVTKFYSLVFQSSLFLAFKDHFKDFNLFHVSDCLASVCVLEPHMCLTALRGQKKHGIPWDWRCAWFGPP